LGEPIIHVCGTRDIDTEFTRPSARRDLGVRSSIDIRIYAQHRWRAHTASSRELRQNATLLLQFEIELADAGLERINQFPIGLSDAGKDNIRRLNACI
jgi:hypothetical protein